tara:strand:+ start:3724 stop:5628 length:1905 start_codon:yes stop_codon:yes gene_type:complete
MQSYIFDLESDGLLDTATCIHSLVLQEVHTGDIISFSANDNDIEEGLKLLMKAKQIVGHNIIKFDIPLIQKVYPHFKVDEGKVFDTLVASRLIWTNLTNIDFAKIDKGTLNIPGKRIGSHALEAWGHRLGEHKGDYQAARREWWIEIHGERPIASSPDRQEWDEGLLKFTWSTWNEDMQTYCIQDVVVTRKLFDLIISKDYPSSALKLEHQVAWIIAQQERNGFLFDEAKAVKLYAALVKKREDLSEELQNVFEPWFASHGDIKTPTKTLNYKDPLKPTRTEGCSYSPVKHMVFNPGSRDHIADRLIALYKWKPKEFTPNGKPKIDESVLAKLPYPEAKRLAEYFLIQKRIGQLAEGDNAWLRSINPNTGRIHGNVNTNGAITGRATHSSPNIGQVPSVGVPFGAECRDLFHVPKGHSLVGVDVSGLELRMLGHYMAKYDKGAYAKEVVNGDIHTANQDAAGLPDRAAAKKFIYMFLYGAGPPKIALDLGLKSPREGARLKSRFLAKTPALKRLIEGVRVSTEKNGYLVGLDRRRLYCRSHHSALNTLLQSAGGLLCKQWMVEFWGLLNKEPDCLGVKQVAWIHDEIQLEVCTERARRVGEIAVQAIRLAGKHFKCRVELTGEYKIGNTWKETH